MEAEPTQAIASKANASGFQNGADLLIRRPKANTVPEGCPGSIPRRFCKLVDLCDPAQATSVIWQRTVSQTESSGRNRYVPPLPKPFRLRLTRVHRLGRGTCHDRAVMENASRL